METKYEFTDESIIVNNHKLYRIKALRDFGNIKAGDLGGFIESYKNLMHDKNCWVGENACVYDNAHVYRDAFVCGNADISGNVYIYDSAHVSGHAHIYGNATIYGDANINGDVHIYDYAHVYDNAFISSNKDILWIPDVGYRKNTITFYMGENRVIYVAYEYFFGDIRKFEMKIKEMHGKNKYRKEFESAIARAKAYF